MEHAELFLLFAMTTPLAWLERCPTYKDQINQLKEKDITTYGFLGYPCLQAADILIYKADFVPVGEDQLPHLELTREIARRFNFLYQQQVFPEPQPLLTAGQSPAGHRWPQDVQELWQHDFLLPTRRKRCARRS